MRVCYFGTYSDQSGYPMNRVVLAGLRSAGVEVITCHEPIWDDAADKMAGVAGIGAFIRRGVRLIGAWLRLSVRFARLPDYDVMVVGYLGHFDVILARLLNLFRRRPLVLNGLISLHDTVVVDRRLVAPDSLAAWLLKQVDRWAFAAADRILIDTKTHAAHLQTCYPSSRGKWLQLWVGADPDGLISTYTPCSADRPVTVLYAGTYIGLHGVPTILEAAARLQHRDDLHFVMLGRGQLLAAAQRQAEGLSNVTFDARWVDRVTLLHHYQSAHIALGVFGAEGKATRVIPCKVFDALACGRVVVSAANPAVAELLQTDRDALLIAAGDAAALAGAIETVADDQALRERLARAGWERFQECCTERHVGRQLQAHLAPLVGSPGGGTGGIQTRD